MRFHFNAAKSEVLRRNPKRGIGFEEAREIFEHPYYQDQRSDDPEQYRALPRGCRDVDHFAAVPGEQQHPDPVHLRF